MTSTDRIRVLGISLSSPGFGYAVMEGEHELIDYGNRIFNNEKNAKSLTGIKKLVGRYEPDLIVLQDINAKGSRRALRIKQLHQKVVSMATKLNLKTVTISGKKMCFSLVGRDKGTKHEVAESIAKRFPNDLMSRLPKKRKAWSSEDRRMDIFDSLGLILTYLDSNQCNREQEVSNL